MRPVSLVCMPWHLLTSPSIQLGTIEAVLREAGIGCRSHSFHLELAVWLESGAPGTKGVHFSIDDYLQVSNRWSEVGVGSWVFAVPPVRAASRERDDKYVTILRERGMAKNQLRALKRLREAVPAFVEHCADEVLAGDPAVVGFTTSYDQTLPSLALAECLKRRRPEIRVVFGGANCEGRMGPALLRSYPWIDAVVRGEGEHVAPGLLEALIEGRTPERLPGLCFRDGDELVEVDASLPDDRSMEHVPTPSYDEYFARLEGSGIADRVLPEIPFESSRGCWWGAKAHCTFCGLNGTTMRYRSKTAERVGAELRTLSSRHGVLDFTAVDNIVDMSYFKDLLPDLERSGMDLRLFYETKANLTREQVRLLHASGVRNIQPGIESLSSHTLELMKKGVTGLQNVRLLKWCRELGIHVEWNMLYGFPGEDPEEYARMARLLPSLVHLGAPKIGRLLIDRFSPYFDRPEEHGLRLLGPLPFYGLLYDADDQALGDLAYSYDYEHVDGRDPRTYVGPLRAEVERWQREEAANQGALTFRRGPDFVVVTDRRTTVGRARYSLDAVEGGIFLACDAGRRPRKIVEDLTGSGIEVDEARVQGVLDEMVEARLVYEEDGKYLSLALPQ